VSRRIGFSPEAEAQLLSLYRYIAGEASPETARQFTDAIVEHCEKLVDFPKLGTPRDDLRPGLRTWTFRRRVTIAYVVKPHEAVILGIFYGGQNFEAIFRDDT
jgi:toxin ParE1/3/4